MAVAAIGWTGDIRSFPPSPSLSLLFNCYLLTSLSYLLTEENLPFPPSFFTFGASYILTPSVSSIRFFLVANRLVVPRRKPRIQIPGTVNG